MAITEQHTHQLAGGEAPGWAYCGAWLEPGTETADPTCPTCAAHAAPTRGDHLRMARRRRH